ncbi:MAG: 50S ribosomal protein L13 [Candidatus Daviesbacteria bacterium]|nr:50S ribosomal protein L13 [Candidatus Daviesbacteria bacterium]
MSTNVLSAKQIKRDWHLIDAKNKILGRLAVEIANKLSGKSKVNYVPYLDNGDFVVVTNAKNIKLTGKKVQQKTYYSHSGYPGGLRVEGFEKLINRRPEEVIRHAVLGMIPRSKLGKSMIVRLKIFAGNEHSYARNFQKEEVSA